METWTRWMQCRGRRRDSRVQRLTECRDTTPPPIYPDPRLWDNSQFTERQVALIPAHPAWWVSSLLLMLKNYVTSMENLRASLWIRIKHPEAQKNVSKGPVLSALCKKPSSPPACHDIWHSLSNPVHVFIMAHENAVLSRDSLSYVQTQYANPFNVARSFRKSSPGDLVLLKRNALRKPPNPQPIWSTPWKFVVKTSSVTYLLELKPYQRLHTVVYIGLLKSYSRSAIPQNEYDDRKF
jgi:hypothetical protein